MTLIAQIKIILNYIKLLKNSVSGGTTLNQIGLLFVVIVLSRSEIQSLITLTLMISCKLPNYLATQRDEDLILKVHSG
jgi:hypothetical protein